jgi:2-dehydropantoate 2-reductase
VPEVLADPRGRRVSLAASNEAARVGHAQGYQLERIGEFDPTAFLPRPGWEDAANAEFDQLAAEMAASIKQHMGIWRDLKVKRRKTEVDVQCGPIVARGAEYGIPTPVNEAVLALTHEIEAGQRGMGWENLDVLLASVPSGV